MWIAGWPGADGCHNQSRIDLENAPNLCQAPGEPAEPKRLVSPSGSLPSRPT
jgi:hypothetical protein